MRALICLSYLIDSLNNFIGRHLSWLVIIAVLVSSGNAVVRYTLGWGSNGLLELQWYLFSGIFLLCSGYVLLKNEHIRIDILTNGLSARARNWIDVFGFIVFLLPMALLLLYFSWPVFVTAWNSQERSPNPGGLLLWPVWLLIPAGMTLLFLQCLSELIKRLAFIFGLGPNALDQHEIAAELLLAEAIKSEQKMLQTQNNTSSHTGS